MVNESSPLTAKESAPSEPRVPQYTGKNRYTVKYDEYYGEYQAVIELDLMDDYDEPARIVKHYWRNASHHHWIERFSGKVVDEDRNGKLWAFLEKLVANLRPSAAEVNAITAQVKKAR